MELTPRGSCVLHISNWQAQINALLRCREGHAAACLPYLEPLHCCRRGAELRLRGFISVVGDDITRGRQSHHPEVPQHIRTTPARVRQTERLEGGTAAATVMALVTLNVVPLLALVLGSTTAFVAPAGRGASWSLPNRQQQSQTSCARAAASTIIGCTNTRRTSTPPVTAVSMSSSDVNDTTEDDKVSRLRATAAAFRAQAEELQDKLEQERRAGAARSFDTFDSNKDGAVGIGELRAGLEGPLKKTFTTQLTARMGRKPTPEEVDAKIAELPGGSLFPDDLARKLIAMYDQNGDGVLQQSEFAPAEELRTRLESIFRDQREEELEARKAERQREMEEKRRAEGKEAVGLGDSNDAAATRAERALCALPYILPVSDGVLYARHLFETFPHQLAWAEPIAAALTAYSHFPFAPLMTFFTMALLASNPQVNKLLRFNMLQAINFDIALIVPGFIGPLAAFSLGGNAKLLPLTNVGSDVLFITLLAAVAYCIGASAMGTFPNKLPLFDRLNRENPDRDNWS